MYMQQWNLSLERQLRGNWLASAAYMGNKATHLRTSDDGNPAVYIPGKSTVANTAQPAADARFLSESELRRIAREPRWDRQCELFEKKLQK